MARARAVDRRPGSSKQRPCAGTDKAGTDVVCGFGGNGTVYGGRGGDWISDGPGDDVVYGGSGNDHLGGISGPDRDSIYAGDGDDSIHAQEGDDFDVVCRANVAPYDGAGDRSLSGPGCR